MPLQTEDVRRLARLAKLSITDDEVAQTLEQLNRVFALIETMQSTDTAGLEPMTHPQASALRLREDVVTEHDEREALQQPAPRVERGLYLVPRVIE